MSWFQDEMNAGDTYQAAPDTGDTYVPEVARPDSFGSDVGESIQMALGDTRGSAAQEGDAPWWNTVVSAFVSPTEDRLNTDVQGGKGTATPGATAKQEEKGLLGKITDFASQNKSLTEMVLKGIGGAVAAKNTQKAATAQLQEKDRLEQQRNAQYSASIANLAKPGIIGRQQALRRIDGTPVFNNGRIA